MTAIHVDVTAEDIGSFADLEPRGAWAGPVVQAMQRVVGEPVAIDWDQDGGIATIGDSDWVLVVDLPEAANDFLTYRWEQGGAGAPLGFELEVPAWVHRLVAETAR